MPGYDRDDAVGLVGGEMVSRLRHVAYTEARRINLCEDDAHDCAGEMVLHALMQAAGETVARPAVSVPITVARLVLRADLRPDQTARWLRRCARNFALNFGRGIVARCCHEGKPYGDSFAEGNENPALVAVAPSAEYDALNRLLRQDVFAALHELPPHARAVFARFDLQGDSLAEIAFSSGKSPNAVKMQLHRTRNYIRAALIRKGYGDDKTNEVTAAASVEKIVYKK